MTLFEALTGGAFDRLNWQHSGEFDQNFSKKSNARGFARGGGGMGAFGIDRYIRARFLSSVVYNHCSFHSRAFSGSVSLSRPNSSKKSIAKLNIGVCFCTSPAGPFYLL